MRAAPIGAYFAGDWDQVITEAKASSAITHAHPDGQTGAIAIALAAAWMANHYDGIKATVPEMIQFVLEHLPKTDTYYGVKKAVALPLEARPTTAALILGNGSGVIASDTVPFCLWCAARHPNNYVEALWTTVSGLGDRDTTCAIVGGIVALSAGRDSIPDEWLQAREKIEL